MPNSIVKLSDIKKGDYLEVQEDFFMTAIQDAELLSEDLEFPLHIDAGNYLVVTDTQAFIYGPADLEFTFVTS